MTAFDDSRRAEVTLSRSSTCLPGPGHGSARRWERLKSGSTLQLDTDAKPPVRSWTARVIASIALAAAGAAIALSPDGRGFAYHTAEGLFFRATDELEAQPIAGTDEPVSIVNPFFSPDGKSLAYFHLRQQTNGQLMRVARSGGAPVPITGAVTYPFGASWESNGTILYGQPEGIYSVPADGGTPELVIPADQGEVLYGPKLLPDGDSVLFTALGLPGTSWDQAQVVMQSLSSDERTVLVRGGSDARYVPTAHLFVRMGRVPGSPESAVRLSVSI